MGRIKQGLDYFPLNTDFMHDRVVRRVMNSPTSSSARITIVSAGCFVCLWSTVSSIPLSTNVTAS